MTVHHSVYRGRAITITTEQRGDGMYRIAGVKVEVREGDEIVTADMPYRGIVHANDAKAIRKAMVEASVYAQASY
jgi:hypothetical protein